MKPLAINVAAIAGAVLVGALGAAANGPAALGTTAGATARGAMAARGATAVGTTPVGTAAHGTSALGAAAHGSHKFTTPIRHVVVLYLENHSFDNVLGFWCDQTKRCIGMPKSVRLENGARVKPSVTPDTVPHMVHSVAGQAAAMDGGKMNGWNLVGGCGRMRHYACVSGYKPRHIPNLIALARKFVVSDKTFSEYGSPSWGGHLYAIMPSMDGFTGDIPHRVPGHPGGPGWGCDSHLLANWNNPSTGALQVVPSCVPDTSLSVPNGGAFQPSPVPNEKTILDELSSAHLSWKIFGGEKNQAGYIWSTCPSVAQCLYTSQDSHLVKSDTFVRTARAGKLPNFSLVVPGGRTAADSEHNATSMTAGDDWVGRIARAVMKGPQWRSTALFITYDDCGCFYDQVPPRTNPDGSAEGPRVPLVIVSPWVKRHFTDTKPTTFAGILGFTEHVLGLPPLGLNDHYAWDFIGDFNFAQVPIAPIRMVIRPLPPSARHLPPINPNTPT